MTVVALVLALFGCSSKPSAPTTQQVSLAVGSTGCTGHLRMTAPHGWKLMDNSLMNPTLHASINAYCDGRAKFESDQPGAQWNLDSVEAFAWADVLHDPATTVQTVHLGNAAAIRLIHEARNNWWMSEDAVVGDVHVGIESHLPLSTGAAQSEKEIESILDHVSVNVRGTQ
ncbi:MULTISPECIES: hypothetical protein [unclassified Leifsonia]|uniref:hypothetical protein n=1 Tax=unclassified Leifsonia TaxID=2663824 RepID=UPI001113D9D8|nr:MULTISPECIES: hypothetical protein [unclassified Leifsonia]